MTYKRTLIAPDLQEGAAAAADPGLPTYSGMSR